MSLGKKLLQYTAIKNPPALFITGGNFQNVSLLIAMRFKCSHKIISDHLCTSAFNHMPFDHMYKLAIFK